MIVSYFGTGKHSASRIQKRCWGKCLQEGGVAQFPEALAAMTGFCPSTHMVEGEDKSTQTPQLVYTYTNK